MIIGIIVGWLIIGLIVGFIASKIVDLHGDDPRLGIGVACGGGIVVAMLYSGISGVGLSEWNWWAQIFAAIGAVAGVITWHGIRSRFVSRAAYTRRSSY